MWNNWQRDEFWISTDPTRLDLMEVIGAHPELQGFRRWILLTRDAHGLYTKFGFTPLADPTRWMERWASDPYPGG